MEACTKDSGLMGKGTEGESTETSLQDTTTRGSGSRARKRALATSKSKNTAFSRGLSSTTSVQATEPSPSPVETPTKGNTRRGSSIERGPMSGSQVPALKEVLLRESSKDRANGGQKWASCLSAHTSRTRSTASGSTGGRMALFSRVNSKTISSKYKTIQTRQRSDGQDRWSRDGRHLGTWKTTRCASNLAV